MIYMYHKLILTKLSTREKTLPTKIGCPALESQNQRETWQGKGREKFFPKQFEKRIVKYKHVNI